MIYYYYNYKLGLYLKINFLKNENLVYKLTKLHLPLPKNLFVGEFSLLKNFFLGNKKKIDVKFDFSGLSNNFVKVLKLIIEIPYGKLVTYSSLSSKLGFNPRYFGYVCKNKPYPILFFAIELFRRMELIFISGAKIRKYLFRILKEYEIGMLIAYLSYFLQSVRNLNDGKV